MLPSSHYSDSVPCYTTILMTQQSEAWKDEALVRKYLDGVRGAIPLARERIDVMLRLVGATGLPVTSFLDLGCGGGALALAMLERFPKVRATLVDFSEPMLAEARERLAPFGAQCTIVRADLAESSWLAGVEPQAPFAAAVSGYAIHHLTDERKRALRRCFGLLRPGAFFNNIEHVSSPIPPARPGLRRFAHR